MTTTDEYDSPWKSVLERYLPNFLAFFFPDAHADIDWAQGYTWLDKELSAIVRDAAIGRRYADKLCEVRLRDGRATRVFIHIEVQGQPETAFAERMWVYHYRIYDRYGEPPVSLAVLADENPAWRPNSFGYARWGCDLAFRFPTAKLASYAGTRASLEANANPFATVVLAHLAAQETRGDAETRAQAKIGLARRLYRLGYVRQDVIDLYAFIDWLLALPAELEEQVWAAIQALPEERRMQYLTYGERKSRAEGRAEGQAEERVALALRLLRQQCGPLDTAMQQRITALDQDQLLALIDALLDFSGPDDLAAWLAASVP